jgi:SAM-dependent methyltransferase
LIRLDIGCGLRKHPGAIGVDVRALPAVDVICDLNRFPYPFASDAADEVFLHHILEHLDDPVRALAEIWRIARNGAAVRIRVPHYTGRYAWKDPTHKHCFTSESFAYFGENAYSYYTPARFAVCAVRLRYLAEKPWRPIYGVWGKFAQWLLDRHPTFGERFLAYLLGGIDEIEVTLVARKPPRAGQSEDCPCQEPTTLQTASRTP